MQKLAGRGNFVDSRIAIWYNSTVESKRLQKPMGPQVANADSGAGGCSPMHSKTF